MDLKKEYIMYEAILFCIQYIVKTKNNEYFNAYKT